jgi:hypothetical protein
MFRWDDCPLALFDQYIEVGTVRRSAFQTEECAFVEVWLASFFTRVHLREECWQPKRRPIYGVAKQIRKLSEHKPVCVVLLCDDGQQDTLLWGRAILLLLRELERDATLRHAILFLRDSAEDTAAFLQTNHWRTEADAEAMHAFLDLPEATVFGQANYYVNQENIHIRTKARQLPHGLWEYFNATLHEK